MAAYQNSTTGLPFHQLTRLIEVIQNGHIGIDAE